MLLPMSTMNRPVFRQLFPHVLIVAVLTGIVMSGTRPGDGGDTALRVLARLPCRLDRGPCRVTLDAGAWLELTLAPRPVPAGAPFSAVLALQGVDVRQALIEFKGTDMNMGLFTQTLSLLPAGGFAANVTLPVCATGAMRWHARLIVRTRTETLVAPFELTTGSLLPVRS